MKDDILLNWILVSLYVIAASIYLQERVFQLGLAHGRLIERGHIGHVKKGTKQEGNILQYKFGKTRGKTPAPSRGDRNEKGGNEPEPEAS